MKITDIMLDQEATEEGRLFVLEKDFLGNYSLNPVEDEEEIEEGQFWIRGSYAGSANPDFRKARQVTSEKYGNRKAAKGQNEELVTRLRAYHTYAKSVLHEWGNLDVNKAKVKIPILYAERNKLFVKTVSFSADEAFPINPDGAYRLLAGTFIGDWVITALSDKNHFTELAEEDEQEKNSESISDGGSDTEATSKSSSAKRKSSEKKKQPSS